MLRVFQIATQLLSSLFLTPDSRNPNSIYPPHVADLCALRYALCALVAFEPGDHITHDLICTAADRQAAGIAVVS